VTKLTLYTKTDCCLCDDARAALERVRRDVGFDLESIDVTTSRELDERYGERVPVIALNGSELFEYRVDEDRLRAILSEQSSAGAAVPAPPTS
jgi:glutaredoxin